VRLAKDAAGEKVAVVMLDSSRGGSGGGRGEGHSSGGGTRRRSRSRSRDRDRRHRHHRDYRSRSSERSHHHREAGAAPPPRDHAVAAAVAAAAAAGKKGWLLALRVEKEGAKVGELVVGPITLHQRIVFGRSPACDVPLEHPSISRQHAALGVDERGGVTLTDLGSAHGTKVEDTWLKPQGSKHVGVGGVMRFGASTRAYKLERVERVG